MFLIFITYEFFSYETMAESSIQIPFKSLDKHHTPKGMPNPLFYDHSVEVFSPTSKALIVIHLPKNNFFFFHTAVIIHHLVGVFKSYLYKFCHTSSYFFLVIFLVFNFSICLSLTMSVESPVSYNGEP